MSNFFNKNLSSNIIKAAVLILLILLFFVVCYFHPTRENMYCDSDFQCSIDKIYFNKLHYKSKIKLDVNSSFDYKVVLQRGRRTYQNGYRYYWLYDNIAPFTYYSYYSTYLSYNDGLDDIKFKTHFLKEQKRFLDYKKNPKNGYSVKSMATQDDFNVIMALYLLLLYGLFCFY